MLALIIMTSVSQGNGSVGVNGCHIISHLTARGINTCPVELFVPIQYCGEPP